jgi:hypothetical protein
MVIQIPGARTLVRSNVRAERGSENLRKRSSFCELLRAKVRSPATEKPASTHQIAPARRSASGQFSNFKFSIFNFQFSIPPSTRQHGGLSIELIVATAMLLGALLPLAYSLASEKRFARTAYQHAVAMEIVDGEMETLMAGEWRGFAPGAHEYHVRANAATNLPPGRFLFTVEARKLRLEWRQTGKLRSGVIREAEIK